VFPSGVGYVALVRTRRDRKPLTEAQAKRWGRRLAAQVESIVREHPEADPDNLRLTLIALELSPEERIKRSLRRGRGFAAFKR
jgi:hypothetical protein